MRQEQPEDPVVPGAPRRHDPTHQIKLKVIMCIYTILAGTSGADDDLWRLRQEVNNLKETLAMQSAYVQTMTPLALSAGVQASTGTGTGSPYFPVSC